MKGYIGLVILYCACIHITVVTSDMLHWVTVGTVQYRFSDGNATFEDAVDACEGQSQLVTFSTPAAAEQYEAFKNLTNLNTSRQYWLGLRRYPGSAVDAKSFYWLDGSNTSIAEGLLGNVVLTNDTNRDEYCLRMKRHTTQWEWWDIDCMSVNPDDHYHYVCMQDLPTTTTMTTTATIPITTPPLTPAPTTGKKTSQSGEQPPEDPVTMTTTAGEVSEKSTGPESPSENESMYIIIGGSLGGAALLVILVICIVIFVVQLRRKRSDERAKHEVTNPTYENADASDEAGAPGNRITTNGNGRVTSGNHLDSIYENRQREVVYTDVETGTKEQQGQGATYEDVSYYNNVQVTANPPKRTDTVGYSEVGMPSQFLAGSGVGAPNVGAEGTPSSAHEDNVAELYAEVVKPQRNPAPKEEKKEEEEETDYYALAPAIPLKLL